MEKTNSKEKLKTFADDYSDTMSAEIRKALTDEVMEKTENEIRAEMMMKKDSRLRRDFMIVARENTIFWAINNLKLIVYGEIIEYLKRLIEEIEEKMRPY